MSRTREAIAWAGAAVLVAALGVALLWYSWVTPREGKR